MTEGPIMKEFKDIPHSKDFGYDVNAPGFVAILGRKGLPKPIHIKLEKNFPGLFLILPQQNS